MDKPQEQYKHKEKLELRAINKEFPKVFKKVCCPSCGEDTPADNLNLQKSIAKCGSCHVIFSIEKEIENVKVQEEMKQEVIRPEGIELFYFKDDLDIVVQQHVQGLDMFGLIIFPMTAFFLIMAYFLKGIPVYYPLVTTVASIYFIYKSFNYSNNKTYIDINDQFLSIKSRPKNLNKDKVYAVEEIDQLYCKHSPDGVGYSVYMTVNGLEGQKHEKLITVNTLSKVKYLEQEIEHYLNIEDRKVPEATV